MAPDEYAGNPEDAITGETDAPGPLPYADIRRPASLNKYAYGYNNPVRFKDPSGHIAIADDVLIVAAVGVLYVAYELSKPETQAAIRGLASEIQRGVHELAKKAGGSGQSGTGQVKKATANPVNVLGGGQMGQPNGPKKGHKGGRGSGKRATPKQREEVLKENDGKCVFCGKDAEHVEHSIARSQGGDTTTGPNGNLQPACADCNLSKGALTSEEFLQREAAKAVNPK